MEKLTSDDISILLESLKAWEEKDLAGDLMSTLLEGMLLKPRNEMEEAQQKADREAKRAKADSERAYRKERSVLLQAKLISMRNSTYADSFIASALGSGR